MSHATPSPVMSPSTPAPPHAASWASSLGPGPATWAKSALPKSIAAIAATLASNSEDWKGRVASMQELEKVVADCREYERVSQGTPAAQSFQSSLGALLSSLAPALSTQITDLRSEIVRQAAHTISACATSLGDSISHDRESVTAGPFHKCGARVLPAVLQMAASSNSVMRGYALQAAYDVVANTLSVVGTGGSGVLANLLSEVKHSKNKSLSE
jgi:hypothetical protein